MKSVGAQRYSAVDAVWASVVAPPITREEADAASRELCRIFGRKTGHDHQRCNVRPGPVRRCWITRHPGSALHRGWARLAHDVSHRIFRYRHPGWRPHHPQHAALELEIATYVAAHLHHRAVGQ